MQSMGFFGENRTLAIILAVLCLLIGVALVFVLFRLVFGGGIKLPGGRSRQQRLGVVDAFEIDRQRQLVIVRRDNVEHLLMIGGPTDVVIESTIIRAETREARGEARPSREQPSISGLSWPAGPAATESGGQPDSEPAPPSPRPIVPEPPAPPVAAGPSPRPLPPVLTARPAGGNVPPPDQSAPEVEPGSGVRAPTAAPSAPPAPPPAPSRPLRTPPPLRPAPAPGERPALSPRTTPLKREPRPLPPFLANRAKPSEPPAVAAAAAAATAETTSDSPAEPTAESPAPASASPPPGAASEVPASPPGAEGQPAAAPKVELDPLESLEEEMAKLLGRSPNS